MAPRPLNPGAQRAKSRAAYGRRVKAGVNPDDVRALKEAMRGITVALYRQVVIEATTRVVLRTPVDTGRARANWNISLGAPQDGTTTLTDPSGQWSINVAGAVTANIRDLATKTFIVNNLPYIPALEWGGYPNPPRTPTGKTRGGYSIQAPQGMVGVTVKELVILVPQMIAASRGAAGGE